METEPEKMLDVMFYRDAILEIILWGQHIAREVCELRLELFLKAADCYYNTKNANRELLEPFPSCFFDSVTKERRYDELSLCISSLPNLDEIQESTSLPELTWMLLHWVFTNPLEIEAIKVSPISEVLTEDIRLDTKLSSIPYPSNDCIRFEIIHPIEINSTQIFLQHKQSLGSFYAYHGSPGHNFHSIIHRGLRCSLNLRSAYGPGTYLSSNLDTATSYSNQYVFRSELGKQRQHANGIRYCIAVVEVIKHPSIKVVPLTVNGVQRYVNALVTSNFDFVTVNFDDTSSTDVKYYVVNSDELMRLKHILVYY